MRKGIPGKCNVPCNDMYLFACRIVRTCAVVMRVIGRVLTEFTILLENMDIFFFFVNLLEEGIYADKRGYTFNLYLVL